MSNEDWVLDSGKEPKKNIETKQEKEHTKTEDLTPEQIVQAQYWLSQIPETPPPREEIESGLEILEFETMISVHEREGLVRELMAITTLEETLASSSRKLVKDALGPILKKLQDLENKKDISPDKLAELRKRYKNLSQAVGIVNSGKVDHTR